MKEATGELNLTIIIVIAVGALMAFLYTPIWPMPYGLILNITKNKFNYLRINKKNYIILL